MLCQIAIIEAKIGSGGNDMSAPERCLETGMAASLEDGPFCKRSTIRSFDRGLERTVAGLMLVGKTATAGNVGGRR
jgi:hypothetical protein